MPINTQQLRTALQTAATNLQTGWNDRTGEAKVENLNLKNLYLSKTGELHVSDKGWARMWNSLLGRKTGEAALRQGMADLGINRPVINRALQHVTEFKDARTGWEAVRGAEDRMGIFLKPGARLESKAGAEPSRNLEGVITAAATGLRREMREKIEAKFQSLEQQIQTAWGNLPLKDIMADPAITDQLTETGEDLLEARLAFAEETGAEMEKLGEPSTTIDAFRDEIISRLGGIDDLSRMNQAAGRTSEGMDRALGSDWEAAEKSQPLMARVYELAPPPGQGLSPILYLDCVAKPFVDKMAHHFGHAEMEKVINEILPKISDLAVHARSSDRSAIMAATFPAIDKALTDGMSPAQQIKYYALSVFGHSSLKDFQQAGKLPKDDEFSLRDLEIMKKVSANSLAAGQFQPLPADGLAVFLQLKTEA